MPSVLTLALVGIACALYAAALLVQKALRSATIRGANGAKNLKVLPGPRGWPLVGSAPALAKFEKPWEGFSVMSKKYGPVFGLQLGSHYCVIVSSFEAMKEVLVYKAADFANRPNFARFAAIFRGHRDLSVALCDWSEKQRRRREITFPITHPRNNSTGFDQLGKCIGVAIADLVKTLKNDPGTDQGAHDILLFASANLFYHFLCTRRFSLDDKPFVATVRNYHSIFCDLFRGYPLDFFPWMRYINGHVLDFLQKLSAEVSQFTQPIFEEHASTIDREAPRDLVDVLLSSDQHLTTHDSMVIIEDLIGGHSALHNMWMWTVALVGINPRVAEKIRAETDGVFEKKDGVNELEMQDRNELVYTEATINEVLRVIASPIIPHRTTKNTSIQGYAIPQDSLVIFNTCDLNMNETLWPEPTTFKPERFLDKFGNRMPKPDHFMPFGTGKRSCLGDGIVRATLLLGMATLVHQFDIKVTKGAHLLNLAHLPGTVLWPQNDISVQFSPRSH